MRVSIARLLREGGLIALIIAGGLVLGALTPAYSQDDLAASQAARAQP